MPGASGGAVHQVCTCRSPTHAVAETLAANLMPMAARLGLDSSYGTSLTVGGAAQFGWLLGVDLTRRPTAFTWMSAYTPPVFTTPSAWRLRISLSL
jgi:hypothetical protein